MGLFSPVKRHANKFRYIPRYYDPEKERRDQRRKELCGVSSQDEGEYTPGQYIRTQRDARRAAKEESEGGRKMPSMVFMLLIAAVAIVLYMLYPRVIAVFTESRDAKAKSKAERYQEMENEAWPHSNANIIVVPNDYNED
jgi:hypothetical protein